MSLADDLQKLQELREEGALSDAEFQQAKRKLLESEAGPPSVSETHIKLDPGLTRATERYANTSSVTSIIGIVAFLVIACIAGFGACAMMNRPGDSGPFRDLCSEPGITCSR